MKLIALVFRPEIDDRSIILELLREFSQQCRFFITEQLLNKHPESDSCVIKNQLEPDYNCKNLKPSRYLEIELNADQQDYHALAMQNEMSQFDYLLVFGGDGTILRSMKDALHYRAAVLGFNMGSLGFLTDCKINELSISINTLLKGKFAIEKRMLLDITVFRNKKKLIHSLALNDSVIYKGELSKLISIKLYSNKRFVYETRCDGMITATPTGSTAYSMSSGGPIISPDIDAIVANPLNPHILSLRPMIFNAEDTLHFKLEEPHSSTVLQIDGVNLCQLMPKDNIIVKRSAKKLSFIKLSHHTYYQILRKKLSMGKL